MKRIKAIWNDTVWSKVIAVFICFLATLLYNWVSSIYQRKDFGKLFLTFWSTNIPLWVVVIAFIVIWLVILYRRILIKKNTKIIDAPAANNIQSTIPNMFFDSSKSSFSDFEFRQERTWQNNQPIGNPGQGKLDISKGILDIERFNTEGRLLIKIIQYLNQPVAKDHIQKNIHLQSDRRISVSFRAKIIGGSRKVRVICKEYNATQWIHNANATLLINHIQWKEYTNIFRVPANKDFVIDLEDFEAEKTQSNLQLKDLLIEELS